MDVDEVRELVARAQAVDSVAPLNEEAWLELSAAGEPTQASAAHLFRWRDGRLAGYLQWQPVPGTAQVVVDPGCRRQGIATDLVDELAAQVGRETVGLWAFGNLPAAQAFALRREMAPVRDLWMMQRPLPVPTRSSSHGSRVSIRSFQPGDADALLALNAAAFAHHAEQGALDHAGLAARMAEEWFDPDGLLLAFDDDGLAGFHWTKRHDAATGEVYVIGVAPRAQGHGVGRVLLDAGLDYLTRQGCATVVLYVDSADEVACTMYETGGFGLAHRDVLYAPSHEESR